MEDKKITYKSIEEYIALFPPEIQEKLQSMRRFIKELVPEAEEKISWQMPTFALQGNLVHFAAHKKHMGFYPGASGVEVFKDKLSDYNTSKGAIQFQFEDPLPFELIGEIVRFRVEENLKEAEIKLQRRKNKN